MTSILPSVLTHREVLLADVRSGLRQSQMELPPKYFYDRRGSELFAEITRLPEYYLTRAERRLLSAWMPSLIEKFRPRTLVELGAGSGDKTRIILRAMHGCGAESTYIPIDVSADFLDASAQCLRAEHPWLRVEPVVADFTDGLSLSDDSDGPTLIAFLGSTIGNFAALDSVRLLRGVRAAMGEGDRLLLGADLRTKPKERIEAAYDDAAGVTAEFNRNMLRVLNRELGADFEVESFQHRAFYSMAHHQVEMHLVADGDQAVSIPSVGSVRIGDGQSIRTEICCKYDRPALETLLHQADLGIDTWLVDPQDQYAVLLAAPIATRR